jgi:hypothetical protein
MIREACALTQETRAASWLPQKMRLVKTTTQLVLRATRLALGCPFGLAPLVCLIGLAPLVGSIGLALALALALAPVSVPICRIKDIIPNLMNEIGYFLTSLF